MAAPEPDEPSVAVGLAIGALGPVEVALALVPVRSELHNANLAGFAVALLLLSLARPAPAAE